MLKKNYTAGLVSFLLIVLVCANYEVCVLGVKTALTACYEKIIPSLFPFMTLSAYLASTEFSRLLSLLLLPFAKMMKINDRNYAAYLFLSIIGGFAVGASFLKKMADEGYDKKALAASCPAFVNNSFSFCVLAVGAGILQNVKTGLLIYSSLTASSLITAFIISFITKYNVVTFAKNDIREKIPFSKAVSDSVSSILAICGFTVFFNVICQVISLYVKVDILKSLIFVFAEVTGGCLETAGILGKNALAMCACLSILPISTLCQVYYFTGDSSILKTLLLSRFIHLPLSLMIFSVLKNLFPSATYVYASSDKAVARAYLYSADISAAAFVCTLMFIAVFDSNRLFTAKRK